MTGEAWETPLLVGHTFELMMELAMEQLRGASATDVQDLERRLDAQVENLTVREARIVMEVAGIIERKLP